MSVEDQEECILYKVVVNHEEQYSIWPADREIPLGWQDAGKSGNKAETSCLFVAAEMEKPRESGNKAATSCLFVAARQ